MLRILIVRLGSLGDIVHALPLVAAIRRARPDARLDWIVSPRNRELLALVSGLDTIIVTETGGAGLGVVRALRRARYDAAIDAQGLIKSALLARASGASKVIGFGPRWAREGLASRFYSDRCEPEPGSHVIRANLELLRPLGIDPPREIGPAEFPLLVPPSPVAERCMEEAGGRYALLNPGAAWPNKRWPPERFGAVARALRDREGLHSIVTWGPGERAIGEAVVEASAGAATLVPETTVADLLALARRARVMVSGDTGPTHLAAAVGTPLVAIFGPTRPARNGPWAARDVSISRDTICGCHHKRQCIRPAWCLLDIQPDEVIDAVCRRLAAETA